MQTTPNALVLLCVLFCSVCVPEHVAAARERSVKQPLPDYLNEQNYPRAKRDQFCAAYAVWHALHHYGLDVSLDGVVGRLKLDGKHGASVEAVVSTINSYGIFAEAGKIDLKNAASLRAPFIPYLPPKRSSQRGRFVFVVPKSGAIATVFDGANAPFDFDLGDLARPPKDQVSWDGVSILLDKPRSNGSYAALGLALPICLASAIVGRWLGASLRTRGSFDRS